MSHSSIYVKGFVLAIIPLLSQTLFLSTLVTIRNDQAYAQDWAMHASRVLAEADALSALAAETHSALYGFLVTEDPRLSQRYQTFQTRTTEKIAALGQLVADNPAQVQRVQAIEARVQTLSAWFEMLHGLIAARKHDEAIKEARTARGEDLIESERAAIREFLHAEEAISRERQERLERQATVQDVVLFGGGVLTVLSTALLGFVFARSIAVRVKQLAENARRIGEGEELLEPIRGGDEIAQLDRTFRDMASSLEQKNRENEMFVYSVSHDLRSPLVNLQGFSQELATSCNDLRALVTEADLPAAVQTRSLTLLDRNMRDSVHFIQTAVTRLSGIIDALLRLSRAGRVEYRWQMVDVQAAVGRIVAALRGTLNERHAQIAVGTLPPVWGDPTAIEQIFANLIGNAVHYLDPQRSGQIEVGVLVAADANGAAANGATEARTFFVRDNGLGLPEAHHAKVFIAFQRLHPDAVAGEGIGLALVRRAIERHGGRIWLESTPGVGTTFFVILPAQPPRSVPPAVSSVAMGSTVPVG
jgi:signal transduction histidine kinase